MRRVLDVCSGYSASTLGWAGLGFRHVGYSEIDAFPRAILEQRHGAVAVDWDHRPVAGSNVTPLFGDFTKIEAHHVGPVDLLTGGTPCQAFSVAGKRLGLDDPRGNLTLEFLALARRLRVPWLAWENVPGFLSHDEGRTMGTFLRLLGELGYGFAWRVLDAQYIRVDGTERAVPQRRKRLFVVGHLGDAAGPAAVLFERESLCGHPAPSREAGQGVAGTIAAGAHPGGFNGQDAYTGHLIAQGLRARSVSKGVDSDCTDTLIPVAHALRAEGFDASEDGAGRGTPLVPVAYAINADCYDRTGEGVGGTAGERSGLGVQPDIAYALRSKRPDAVAFQTSGNCGAWETGDIVGALDTGTDPNSHVVALDTTQITSAANRSSPKDGDPCHPLASSAHPPAIAFQESESGVRVGAVHPTLDSNNGSRRHNGVIEGWAVRRLTPLECERLMGVPDGFTAITYRGKPAADGPRYKALGNSQATNVMRWIGHGLRDVMAAQASIRSAA